jgi:hypothetical protein
MVEGDRFPTIAFVLVGAMILGAPIDVAYAQTDWGRYKPGTIAAVMQLHDSRSERITWRTTPA